MGLLVKMYSVNVLCEKLIEAFKDYKWVAEAIYNSNNDKCKAMAFTSDSVKRIAINENGRLMEITIFFDDLSSVTVALRLDDSVNLLDTAIDFEKNLRVVDKVLATLNSI